MKRRKFLLLLGGAAGSLVIPTALYFISPSVKQYAVLLIKRELSYLNIKAGSVEAYVNDYFKGSSNNILFNIKWKTMYYLRTEVNESVQFFELVKYYLLSSNFFMNKADENLLVEYVGLFSPYTSPAPNPYSFILYPPNEVREP